MVESFFKANFDRRFKRPISFILEFINNILKNNISIKDVASRNKSNLTGTNQIREKPFQLRCNNFSYSFISEENGPEVTWGRAKRSSRDKSN